MDYDKKGPMLTWNEIRANYPNQWVVLGDYELGDGIEVNGDVIAHGETRKELTPVIKNLFSKYQELAVRYTGASITDSEIPVLWRTSSIPR